MYDVVHIDEKWFEITKVNCRYILTPTKPNPERGVQSKQHIPKIMFLCAVARPKRVGNAHFDGKIGIWPFAHQVPALRNSIIRPAGTLEWKPVSVTTVTYTKMLRDKVILAIHDKFPHEVTPLITIQHNNAPPHKAMDDKEVEEHAMQEHGLNVVMEFQPSNSPDTNVLDLGFFRSLESLQQQRTCNNLNDLIENVRNVFANYKPHKLNDVFLTLQTVLQEIICRDGTNKFHAPHMGKARLRQEGNLPNVIPLDQATAQKVETHIASINTNANNNNAINADNDNADNDNNNNI